jgi:hypothetical protein
VSRLGQVIQTQLIFWAEVVFLAGMEESRNFDRDGRLAGYTVFFLRVVSYRPLQVFYGV